MSSMRSYSIAGLRVVSEIDLPELVTSGTSDEAPNLRIVIGKVPDHLEDGVHSMPEAQVAPGSVLLDIPGVSRMLVQRREIRVAPAQGAAASDVRLFLLGSALGAVHFLRGDFPLHASVVVVNGHAIAFSGDSGAGKSTLAAWMNRRGHRLLCDDVCVLRFSGEQALAYPAYPRLKLTPDALSRLNLQPPGLAPDHSDARKYQVAAGDVFSNDPIPLSHVLFLRFVAPAEAVRIRPIAPAQSVALLRDNTYRFQFISGLGLTRDHFMQCARLARTIRAGALERPEDPLHLERCVQVVEELLA